VHIESYYTFVSLTDL